ncbi:MAG: hypothetical protein ACPL7K_07505 [Armatimonadota bacterium]
MPGTNARLEATFAGKTQANPRCGYLSFSLTRRAIPEAFCCREPQG